MELVHVEGAAGLYSGFKATLCRNMLYNVAQVRQTSPFITHKRDLCAL